MVGREQGWVRAVFLVVFAWVALIAGSRVTLGEEGITDVSGWSDERLEEFLATAAVADDEELGTGVTVPHRLTLEKDGDRVRAIFKYHEGYITSVSGTSPMVALNQSDSYQYDIATYRLDRILGMDLVPVAVTRTVSGKTGAIQLWIEDSIDEAERAEKGIQPDDKEEFDRQWMLMQILDVLIYNIDRHAGNVLITEDGKLHAIDHTRAFRTNGGRPEHLRKVKLTPSGELLEKLEALDNASLKQELSGLIHPMQIKALLKRRSQIVKDALKASPS